jgi:hypothetical protein
MDENPYRGPHSDGAGPPQQKKGRISTVFKVLAVLGIIGLGVCLFLPAVRSAREPARRNSCTNKLHQIAIALQNYADVYRALPPAYTVDADGKPLHSWRTLILPYLEEEQLYKTIDLTKPWDDPANAEACKTSLHAYQCPSSSNDDNRTTYVAVLTPNSCFRPTEPRKLSEITDDASETLMVIEVDTEHAVPWMSPVDADEKVVMGIGPNSKLAHNGGLHGAAFVDGSVRFLDADMPAAQRRALISIAGNDKAAAKGAD